MSGARIDGITPRESGAGGGEAGSGGQPGAPKISADTRALLFDLGHVVVGIDWSRAFAHWAQAAGVDAARLRDAFRVDESYQAHERGELELPDFLAELRKTLGVDLDDAQLDAGWNAIFTGTDDTVIAIIERVRPLLPVYAFTNTNHSHRRCFMGLYPRQMALFETIFDSSELGMRKPEARAFQAVIAAIGAAPGQILFFDDLPDNIAAARECGLQAVLVTESADVVRAVDALLAARGVD